MTTTEIIATIAAISAARTATTEARIAEIERSRTEEISFIGPERRAA